MILSSIGRRGFIEEGARFGIDSGLFFGKLERWLMIHDGFTFVLANLTPFPLALRALHASPRQACWNNALMLIAKSKTQVQDIGDLRQAPAVTHEY